MHYLPVRARVSILAAAACYREIGLVVGRDVALSWDRRAVVSRSRKAVLVARACGAARGYTKPPQQVLEVSAEASAGVDPRANFRADSRANSKVNHEA